MLKKCGITLLIVALAAGCSSKTDENVKKEQNVVQKKVEQVKVEPKVDLVKVEKDKRQKYSSDMLFIFKNTANTDSNIAELLELARVRPMLFGSQDWKTDLNKQHEQIGYDYDAIKKYPQEQIPDAFKNCHDILLKSYDTKLRGGEKILQAVNETNSGKMAEGINLRIESRDLFDKYTKDIMSVPDPK